MKINKLIDKFKIIFIICILLSGVLFVSCEKNSSGTLSNKNNGVITKSRLTSEEEKLVESLADRYFIFDVEFGKEEYQWVELWVDEYEKGVKKERVLGFGSSLDNEKEKNSRIIVSINDNVADNNKNELWSFALVNNNGIAKAKSTITKKESAMASTWDSVENLEIKEGDTLSLATMLYSKDGSFRSLSKDFFKEPEKYTKELAEYDYAYIIKCKFLKEHKDYVEKINIDEVSSIDIKFNDILKETYTKQNNAKEIERFINAYNNSFPFIFEEDEKSKNHINVVIKLEGGEQILLSGGTKEFINVTKNGQEMGITGEDIINIFKEFSSGFNND
ncbi:hypothetical protein KQI86_05045 [Clostridium sp. MSJ-11]|uniref:Lipoprotein n=1 Tax=Clostridium mobile TaxID=2841512 RepID=A0ABS6EEW3_9CLOT|nr:hypothetical protein [Clostridium mobile]MBU5483687.1 hypothetical protein [Clostridium mobile]